MILYIVPQVPVKNRYQEYWISWWSEMLYNTGVFYDMLVPYGSTGYLEVDFKPNDREFFAPVNLAVFWDADISKRIIDVLNVFRPEDYLLFLDFDFTGMFQGLLPLFKRYNPKIRTGAYIHAGSWGEGDYFSPVRRSKMYIEYGFLEVLDHGFVPTNSAKRDMIEKFEIEGLVFDKDKIHVVGTLWKPYKKIYKAKVSKAKNIASEKWIKDDRTVLINGRMESLYLSVLDEIVPKLKREGVKIVATDARLARKYKIRYGNYFNFLGKAKVFVQPKKYETFGIAVVEALYSKTIPVLSNIPTYQELYSQYIADESDYFDKIMDIIDNYEKYLEPSRSFFVKIEREYLRAPLKILEVIEK